MKKCTFCDSELLASKESESAKCWLCGGTTFVDISEEESKRRKRQGEKKELCCPEPDCLIDLVENQRKFCVNCGRRLEKVTIDLWLRKCVDPRLKNDSRKVVLDRRVLIRDAWKMGLPKERAEKNLDEYIKGLIRPPISATQESSRQACLGSSKSLSTPRVGEVLPSQKPSHQKGALLVREC